MSSLFKLASSLDYEVGYASEINLTLNESIETECEQKENKRLAALVKKSETRELKLRKDADAEEEKRKRLNESIEQLPNNLALTRKKRLFELRLYFRSLYVTLVKGRRSRQAETFTKDMMMAIAHRYTPKERAGPYSQRILEAIKEEVEEYKQDEKAGRLTNEMIQRANKQWKIETRLLFRHTEILNVLSHRTKNNRALADYILFFLIPKGAVMELRFLRTRFDFIANNLVSCDDLHFTLALPVQAPLPAQTTTYRYSLGEYCSFKTESDFEKDCDEAESNHERERLRESRDMDADTSMELTVEKKDPVFNTYSELARVFMEDAAKKREYIRFSREQFEKKPREVKDFVCLMAGGYYRQEYEQAMQLKQIPKTDEKKNGTTSGKDGKKDPDTKTTKEEDDKKWYRWRDERQDEDEKKNRPTAEYRAARRRIRYDDYEMDYRSAVVDSEYENLIFTRPVMPEKELVSRDLMDYIDPYNLRVVASHPDLNGVLFAMAVRRCDSCFKCPAVPTPMVEPDKKKKKTSGLNTRKRQKKM